MTAIAVILWVNRSAKLLMQMIPVGLARPTGAFVGKHAQIEEFTDFECWANRAGNAKRATRPLHARLKDDKIFCLVELREDDAISGKISMTSAHYRAHKGFEA